MSQSKLKDVTGIGPHALGVMKKHGITTLEHLADTTLEALVKIPGFGEARGKAILAAAKELLAKAVPAAPEPIMIPRAEPKKAPAKSEQGKSSKEASPKKSDAGKKAKKGKKKKDKPSKKEKGKKKSPDDKKDKKKSKSTKKSSDKKKASKKKKKS